MKFYYLYLTGILLCFLIHPAFCQTIPPLGKSSSFAILGASTVTATGIDTIAGNLGVSPGTSVTGFPPGVLENGQIYTGAGSLASLAISDANVAYYNLAGQTGHPTVDLTGSVLGVTPGAIKLSPGIYHYNTSAFLTDTLFLNDGGNANAIFIFQIGTTLITTANSVVIMSSGGRGKNVYWQIGTSATFGKGTNFIGNLIAYTSITMNIGAFTTGKVFALNGATTVNGTYVEAVGKTWTGKAGTTKWSDAGNWKSVGVPLYKDFIQLDSAAVINVDIAANSKSILISHPNLILTISPGASLTVNKSLSLNSGSIINNGTLILYGGLGDSSGTITNHGTIEMDGISAQAFPSTIFPGNLSQNLVLNNNAGVSLTGPLNLQGTLLVEAGNFNTGGFLTLGSSSLQTAQVDGSGSGTILGKVTMQRYLPIAYGYKYFSSPVQAATVGSFASVVDLKNSFPQFYSYVENQPLYGFKADTTASNLLSPLQGYAANFGSLSTPETVNLTGDLTNGAVSVSLYNNNRQFTQGFNLVGNPYPSPIDWDAPAGWVRTNIDNAVYYFDSGKTDPYTGIYSSYVNGISSDGIAGNIIASMQGFFVHVSNGSFPVTGTLSASNPVRVNNLAPFFHKINSIHRNLIIVK